MSMPKLLCALALALILAAAACLSADRAYGQCGPGGCPPNFISPNPNAQPLFQPPRLIQPEPPLVPVPPLGDIPEAVKQCHWSMVEIRCGRTGGSGTYLGGGLVYTCEHVGRHATPEAMVSFPSGQKCRARLVGSDAAGDLAVLQLLDQAPPEAAGVPVDERPPQVGQSVYMAGYGGSQLMISPGRITNLSGYTQTRDPFTGTPRQRPTSFASSHTVSGDSGGAWLSADGQLVGVVWGAPQQHAGSAATTETGGMCTFLRNLCNRLRIPFPRPGDRRPGSPNGPEEPKPPVLPPVVDLSPVVGRLDKLDKVLVDVNVGLKDIHKVVNNHAQVLDNHGQRIETLENPPRTDLVTWLAMIGAAIAGVILFYAGQQ